MAETKTTNQDILTAVTQAEATARDTLMGGVNSTDAAWDKIREVTGSMRALLERQSLDAVNVESDYGAVGDGVTDDTSAINAAITAAGTQKSRTVVFPGNSYRITSPITANVFGVKLIGAGYSAQDGFAETAGRTKILKDGNFDGIVISQSSVSLEGLDILGNTGNGGDAISIEESRCTLRDISCRLQGGVGIRIGKNSFNNNLWRMYNVLCLGNVSHGIYIHDDGGGAPDVNAGCAFGLDLRGNGGDGLRLENAIDNQFYGFHAASNIGWGINLLSGAKGHSFFFPYLENNTLGEGNLTSGAQQNMIWGVRTGVDDGWTIGATSDDNVILGRNNSLNDMFMVMGNIAFEELNIGDHPFALSGLWKIIKNSSTRDLEIIKKATQNINLRLKAETSGTTSLVLDEGDITLTLGNLVLTSGSLTVNGGNIDLDTNQKVTWDSNNNNALFRDGTAGTVALASANNIGLIMDSEANSTTGKVSFLKDTADPDTATEVASIDEAGTLQLDGDLNHDGSNVGFYGTVSIAKQTGVAVTAAGIHAALVNLGLISA